MTPRAILLLKAAFRVQGSDIMFSNGATDQEAGVTGCGFDVDLD